MFKKLLVASLIVFVFSTQVQAQETPTPMRSFLMSCAYGVGIGAAVGLTSLLFTEDPNAHLNQITRGASLGLYVGIAVGAAKINKQNKQAAPMEESANFILQPTFSKNKLSGAQISFVAFKF